MRTPSDIIQAMGGPAKIAAALRIQPPAVTQWGRRERIPGKYWVPLSEAAKAARVRGVTVAALSQYHARRGA